MSILGGAGFDDGLYAPMIAILSGGSTTVQTTTKRTGTHAVKFGAGGVQTLRYAFPNGNVTTGWIYFAIDPRIASGNDLGRWFKISDAGTTQLELRLNAANRLVLYLGGTGSPLATGTTTLPQGVWSSVAIKFTIANSGGTCEVRLNGNSTPDINYTGDTQQSANAYATFFDFMVQGSHFGDIDPHTFLDDFLFQDATGAAPENDWLVDPGLYPILVTGDEASSGYVAAGTTPAATLWQSVDDPTSDELVTTIESSVVGDLASFNMASFSAVGLGTIYAYINQIRADKSLAGLRQIQARAKLGSTVALSSNLTLTNGFLNHQGIFHRDPDGTIWTLTNINATKLGVVTAV